jgi:hypothetical protein
MIDLHYWPTPNGHKVAMFLEETAMPYRWRLVVRLKPGSATHCRSKTSVALSTGFTTSALPFAVPASRQTNVTRMAAVPLLTAAGPRASNDVDAHPRCRLPA